MIDLLKLIRPLIADGRHRYICIAALHLYVSGVCTRELYTQLEKHISSLIGSRIGLETWLVDNGHTTRKYLQTQEGQQAMRDYRLAFIDHLIKQLEN